jgi:hypothetical protein
MDKRTRTNIIVAPGIVLLIICIFGWQYYAKIHFKKLTLEWNNRSVQVVACKAKIIGKSGIPLEEISYADLILLVNSFSTNRVCLNKLQKRMASGEGMKPWFPSQRASISTSMQEWIDTEIRFADQAQSAIAAVSEFQQRSSTAIAMSSTVRLKAVGILNANTDIDDFHKQVSESLISLRTLPPLAKAVSISQETSHLAGMAENLRTAMLRKMASEINREEGLQQNRIAATRAAQNDLINYKNELEQIIQERMGTVIVAENIANFIEPAIENVFQAVRPVRDFLDEASRPILGGESSLAWASRIDPNVRITATMIEGLCSGIESARREVSDMIIASNPLIESLSEFRSTGSRESIKNVVRASQSTASYYEAKIDIFDTLISNIYKAQQKVNELFDTVNRLRLPIIEVAISRLAEAAGFLVKSAKAPLEQGKNAIGNISRSLSTFSSLEEKYLSSLRSLSADSPVALAADTLWLDETRLESIDDASHAAYEEPPRLKQIAPSVILRSTPVCVGDNEEGWQEFVNRLGTVGIRWLSGRPQGFKHDFEFMTFGIGKVVVDYATGLMWHRGGSETLVYYEDINAWLDELNNKKYAGYSDWRLPTAEEAGSLIEESREGGERALFISPLFNDSVVNRFQIWTGDTLAWHGDLVIVEVDYSTGSICSRPSDSTQLYVRPVRSIK